jgi:hypothetical protein
MRDVSDGTRTRDLRCQAGVRAGVWEIEARLADFDDRGEVHVSEVFGATSCLQAKGLLHPRLRGNPRVGQAPEFDDRGLDDVRDDVESSRVDVRDVRDRERPWTGSKCRADFVTGWKRPVYGGTVG